MGIIAGKVTSHYTIKIGNKLLTLKEELERHPVWAIG